MREKIILQDFTVLLVCPSHKWSTIERRAIFDSTYLRNIGGNPVLLCLKGSQIDIEAEREDIPRIYLAKGKRKKKMGLKSIFDIKNVLDEGRFDIVHCYNLQSVWLTSFILKSNQKVALFFTLNHHMEKVQHGLIAKWLLKRIDAIFTLSNEIREYACENFGLPHKKVKNLGSGIDILNPFERELTQVKNIGCVINNLTELHRIHQFIKIFRILKSRLGEKYEHLSLSFFLGPRVYQKDSAKKILKDLDYEFYEGDIFLYSLESKISELKKLDILFGVSFDEPQNDFEITSLMYGVPVLFPRTASRQSLLFRYKSVGESYLIDDIREAHVKLGKMIKDYPRYMNSLAKNAKEVCELHGVDSYSSKLKESYESSFEKRQRFMNSVNH